MREHPEDHGLASRSASHVVVSPLVCQECCRPWLDRAERWRVYVASYSPPLTVPYCPECAEREFG